MKKNAQRDANTARALAAVRFRHRPPVRTMSQTNRQDRLQYTAPQLASAQCNNNNNNNNISFQSPSSALTRCFCTTVFCLPTTRISAAPDSQFSSLIFFLPWEYTYRGLKKINNNNSLTVFLFQRLSIALQRGNAVSFLNTMNTE